MTKYTVTTVQQDGTLGHVAIFSHRKSAEAWATEIRRKGLGARIECTNTKETK